MDKVSIKTVELARRLHKLDSMSVITTIPLETISEHDHEAQLPVFQYALLFSIGSSGIAINVAVLLAILCKRTFRKSSNAFVAHHCFLNLITAGYCVQYGFNVMYESDTPVCVMFGAVFFIALTATAFNILGITMNEIYLLADDRASIPKETANCFCVMFCIITIWFSSLILHLGITLLPGNPTFIKEVGHCTFKYGQPGNYVLHTMWIGLVSVVLLVSVLHLKRFYHEISRPNDDSATDGQHLIASESMTLSLRSRAQSVSFQTLRLRKFYTITVLTLLFVIFWYPLFLLTVIDPGYHASPLTYKGATIFAGLSCVAKPLVLFYLVLCNSSQKPVSMLTNSRTTQTLIKSDSIVNSDVFDI